MVVEHHFGLAQTSLIRWHNVYILRNANRGLIVLSQFVMFGTRRCIKACPSWLHKLLVFKSTVVAVTAAIENLGKDTVLKLKYLAILRGKFTFDGTSFTFISTRRSVKMNLQSLFTVKVQFRNCKKMHHLRPNDICVEYLKDQFEVRFFRNANNAILYVTYMKHNL